MCTILLYVSTVRRKTNASKALELDLERHAAGQSGCYRHAGAGGLFASKHHLTHGTRRADHCGHIRCDRDNGCDYRTYSGGNACRNF